MFSCLGEGWRRALLRNVATELLERKAVRTTDAKAKELRRSIRAYRDVPGASNGPPLFRNE
jgi:hypothetical protein